MFKVPLNVLLVASAKYITPNHEVISVITDKGELKIYEKVQDPVTFGKIVEHVKIIEPFAPYVKPEAPVEVKPLPEPPAEPVVEPAPVVEEVRTQPAPEAVVEPALPVEEKVEAQLQEAAELTAPAPDPMPADPSTLNGQTEPVKE